MYVCLEFVELGNKVMQILIPNRLEYGNIQFDVPTIDRESFSQKSILE